jgi:hypothetical protein
MQAVNFSLTSSINLALEMMQFLTNWLGRTATTCISFWLMSTVAKITELFAQTIESQKPAPDLKNRAIHYFDDATGNQIPMTVLQLICDYSIHDIIEWVGSYPNILEQPEVQSQILNLLQNDRQNLPVTAIVALANCSQKGRYEPLILQMLHRNGISELPDFQLPDLFMLREKHLYTMPAWASYLQRQFKLFNVEMFKRQSANQLLVNYECLSKLSDSDWSLVHTSNRQTLLQGIEHELLADNNAKFKALTDPELGTLASVARKNGHRSTALSHVIFHTLDTHYMRLFDAPALAAFFLYPFHTEDAPANLLIKVQNELIRGSGEKLRSIDGETLCEIIATSVHHKIWKSHPDFMKAVQIEFLRNSSAKLRSCTQDQLTQLSSAFNTSILFQINIRELQASS